jgi:undecaprenyl diphosphate synthase
MDGNGRWAQSRGLPRVAGHRQGAEAVRRTIKAAVEIGISYLTLYGFSLENWKRPQNEVVDLMGLLRLYLREEIDELDEQGVRTRFIGERHRLSPDIVRLIENAEERTRHNVRLNLLVAISYGARQEITAAVRRIAQESAAGRLDPSKITEDVVSGYLETAGVPDPDLLIRTSGEKRISNFLLWQGAYAELYFCDVYWPEFDPAAFDAALAEYASRARRFGR